MAYRHSYRSAGPGGGGGAGSDTDSIHDNVAAEISAVTEKSSPVAGDWFLIEDSAAANAKKRVSMGNLVITESQISDLAHTPDSHAASHQNGGGDEVATATAAANAIPKAGAGSTLADGWIAESNVTQHEAALTITESQISDLDHTVTSAPAVYIDVRKGSAGTINKGETCYVSGYNVGGWVEVEKADADDAAKMPALGLAATSITNSSTAQVIASGNLADVDTSSWSVGDEVFVSATVGTLTSTKPAGETSAIQKMGIVARSHAVNGALVVFGAGRSNAAPNLDQYNTFIGDASNYSSTIQNHYAKTVAPGASDDGTAGWSVGSSWIDTTGNKAYVCLDTTTSAAVWTETTQAGGAGVSDLQGAYDGGEGVTMVSGTPITLTLASIGGNDSEDNALTLQNTTASPSAGNEQNSPSIELLGTAYNSGIGGSQVKGSRVWTECQSGTDGRGWMRFQSMTDGVWYDTLKLGAQNGNTGPQLQIYTNINYPAYAFDGQPDTGLGVGSSDQVQLWVAGAKNFNVDGSNCTVAAGIQFKALGGINIGDATDVELETTTGSKIGTATTQKLGFWGVTPVVQPSSTGEATGHTQGSGDVAYEDSTFTGNSGSTAYTIGDVVKHLKAVGILLA